VSWLLSGLHVIPLIGGIKLKELTADHVDEWLELTGKLATRQDGQRGTCRCSLSHLDPRALRGVARRALGGPPKAEPGADAGPAAPPWRGSCATFRQTMLTGGLPTRLRV
jgi:hypothetical protein